MSKVEGVTNTYNGRMDSEPGRIVEMDKLTALMGKKKILANFISTWKSLLQFL